MLGTGAESYQRGALGRFQPLMGLDPKVGWGCLLEGAGEVTTCLPWDAGKGDGPSPPSRRTGSSPSPRSQRGDTPGKGQSWTLDLLMPVLEAEGRLLLLETLLTEYVGLPHTTVVTAAWSQRRPRFQAHPSDPAPPHRLLSNSTKNHGFPRRLLERPSPDASLSFHHLSERLVHRTQGLPSLTTPRVLQRSQ